VSTRLIQSFSSGLYYKHDDRHNACTYSSSMSASDASWIIVDDSRATLQIVASLTYDSRGITYNCNVYSTGHTWQY